MDAFEITQLLTDEYSAKILVGTFKSPRSAIELSREHNIPVAACYRRIKTLEKAGLIKCVEKALTKKGKRIGLYASQLKNAYIFFEGGKIRVRFELLNGEILDHDGPAPVKAASEN